MVAMFARLRSWAISRRELLLFAVIAGAITLPAAPLAAEANWPQWRGPEASGVAPDSNPPIQWSETQNVKWKVKLPGSGSATPIIWQDKIYIQTAIELGSTDEATTSEQPPADMQSTFGASPFHQVSLLQEQSGQQSEGRGDRGPRGPAGDRPGGGRRGGGRGGFGAEKPTKTYQFVLMCLDRQTGKTLWQKVAREEVPHEGHHQDHGYSSSSPTTDGKYVISYFGSRGLHAFDMDGNLKWSKDLGRMQTRMAFGEGSSPALFGNTIVVNWDHEGDDFIAAFDKRTGDELWRQTRDEITTWATPLIVEHEGKAQVITAGTSKVRSYDLKSGELIWEAPGLTTNSIPSPVHRDGVVYAMSGFRGAALYAIRLGSTGDLTGTDAILWSHNRSTPYVPSPLLYGNRLYFFAANNAILSCFDATTGKALIEPQRVEGISGVYASPVGAAGHVYLVGRDGTTVVIKDADTYQPVATNKLDDRIDASPAIVGDEIFLRGHEYLYCIAEK